MDTKEKAVQFFKSILKNVNPREFLPEIVRYNSKEGSLKIFNQLFKVKKAQKIFVTGSGKASPTMAAAMEDILGDTLEAGFVITPPNTKSSLSKIKMMEGSHPLPDLQSEVATKKLISFIKSIPEHSLVINLLSGGTSALLCKPAEKLKTEELNKVFSLLLGSGADIHEVNTVRKALSEVKGGRLLAYFNDVTLIDLVISDVPNDELATIGSGPTTPQEISYDKAFKVLKKYFIWNDLPHDVRNYLACKMEDELKDGKSFSSLDIPNHQSWIVSSATKVAEKTESMLKKEGYRTKLDRPAWSGHIGEFEDHLIDELQKILEDKTGKKALITFGEATVKVTGDGLGGRNQEIALRIARRLNKYEKNITFLSAGTDGIDGPTDAAGAVVDQTTYKDALKREINPDDYLNRNDSYYFFQKAGGHIKTGPTGNNVMDLQFFLIDK